jgi:hypothetical protein
MALRFTHLPVLVALTLSLPLAAPALGQDMPTVLPNNYVMSDILNRQRVDSAINSGRDGTARSARQPAHPASPAPAITTYRASPEVSARVRRQFADWMGRQAGAGGGRRIAEAMAGYWILNWVMANGADSDRAQALAVRDQIRPIIASNPGYARLDNAQRQELSEVLMLNFLIQHAAYVDAMKRGDRDTAPRLGDAAVARFRSEMGVDLRRLELTKTGFVPAG